MKNKKNITEIFSSDPIRDAWESLGIAFVFNKSQVCHADPEFTLLQTLGELYEDRKMLKLILAWLREYRELIHVERVKALSVNLSPINLAWLGGIALHQANEGDLRWRVIIRLVEKKLGKYAPYFKTTRFDALQGKRLGVDPFFARFGLPIPCLQAADERKIRPRKHVIASHLWLRMRLLFGTNWRADIAVVMIRGLAQTPYQTAKILGCNYETAYRNWKSLKETEVETLGFVANLDSCK